MTKLRIHDTARPGRVIDRWSADVDPVDVPKLMQLMQGRRAVRPDWSRLRLAISAYHERRGWLTYEQPL